MKLCNNHKAGRDNKFRLKLSREHELMPKTEYGLKLFAEIESLKRYTDLYRKFWCFQVF